MASFTDKVDFVKVPKFVVKATNVAWDSYFNFETQKWGGLINASKLSKEDMQKTPTVVNSEIVSYDKVIGQ